MMDAHTVGIVLVGSAGLAVLVWVLHKIGKVLIAVFEALATIAVVFLALWAALKTLVWLARQVVAHWRTSITVLSVAVWWQCWGWPTLVLTLSVVTAALAGWRWVDL